MKSRMVLLVGTMVLCLGLVGTPASWANSLTFQDVTFDLTGGGSALTFTVTNADGATGDWAGIDGFANFSLRNIGSVSGLSLTDWTVSGLELNASGCDGGASGSFCFTHDGGPLSLSHVMTFNIGATTGAFDLTGTGDQTPHLKVLFTTEGEKTGSLLSQNVPANGTSVPVPGTLLMFGLAFVLFVGWYQWYKRPAGLDGATA